MFPRNVGISLRTAWRYNRERNIHHTHHREILKYKILQPVCLIIFCWSSPAQSLQVSGPEGPHDHIILNHDCDWVFKFGVQLLVYSTFPPTAKPQISHNDNKTIWKPKNTCRMERGALIINCKLRRTCSKESRPTSKNKLCILICILKHLQISTAYSTFETLWDMMHA
jgi:hypothetical protein